MSVHGECLATRAGVASDSTEALLVDATGTAGSRGAFRASCTDRLASVEAAISALTGFDDIAGLSSLLRFAFEGFNQLERSFFARLALIAFEAAR